MAIRVRTVCTGGRVASSRCSSSTATLAVGFLRFENRRTVGADAAGRVTAETQGKLGGQASTGSVCCKQGSTRRCAKRA